MSQERSARLRSAILVRVFGSLLLGVALVCASAPRTAGQAGGGLIAFEAGGTIYVMDGGGNLTEIVSGKVGVNMQPVLSPDGSRVAFSGQRGGKFSIYVVNVDGSGLRRVTDGPGDDSEPAWSPDGSRLAFVRGFDPTGSGVILIACQWPGDILVVNVGEVLDDLRSIEINLTNGMGGTDPAWSPDGSRIAFASDPEGNYNYDIYTMSSEDGGGVLRLTVKPTQEADPVWSPDGLWIAYTSSLREVPGAGCGNMPIAGSPTGGGNTGGGNNDEESDGFTSHEGPYIYRMAFDGSQQKSLTVSDGAAEPSWSPDGSQILFVGGPKGDDVQLYLIAPDSTEPWIPLTSDRAQKSSPSWSGKMGR